MTGLQAVILFIYKAKNADMAVAMARIFNLRTKAQQAGTVAGQKNPKKWADYF